MTVLFTAAAMFVLDMYRQSEDLRDNLISVQAKVNDRLLRLDRKTDATNRRLRGVINGLK